MKRDVPLREGYDTPKREPAGPRLLTKTTVCWEAEDVRVILADGHPPLVEMGLRYGYHCDCGGTVVCVTWSADGQAKILRNCSQCGKALEPIEHRVQSF
jgi:hypothetical protein